MKPTSGALRTSLVNEPAQYKRSSENGSLQRFTTAYKALGDPTRLRILMILSDCELRVGEIVEILAMGQSRISRHLRIMVEAGILSARRSGVWTFYCMDPHNQLREIVNRTTSFLESNPVDLRRREEILAQRRRETKEFFDDRAGEWEAMKKGIFGRIDPDDVVAKMVPPCRTVADIGCGEGRLLELVSNRAESVIGVDNSSAMVEYARSRFSSNARIEVRLGDVEHLPIGDGEVDTACMSLVLHHLPRPSEAIAELSRVLSPGGRAIVAELTPHAIERLREIHGDRWLGVETEQIESWLIQSGFTIESTDMHELADSNSLQCITARKNI